VLLWYAHLRCRKFISRSRRKIVFNLIRSYIRACYSNLDCKSFVENWRNSLNLHFREHALLSLLLLFIRKHRAVLCLLVSMRWWRKEIDRLANKYSYTNTNTNTQAHTHIQYVHMRPAGYYKRLPKKLWFFNVSYTYTAKPALNGHLSLIGGFFRERGHICHYFSVKNIWIRNTFIEF